MNREQWKLAFLDMLSFIPFGFLIVLSRRPPMRPVLATLLAVAFAVALAAGKFLFAARHTSLANLVMQAVGGLLGALLALWLVRAKGSAAIQA
jgi:glycopeptide antibiotics resistance protein